MGFFCSVSYLGMKLVCGGRQSEKGARAWPHVGVPHLTCRLSTPHLHTGCQMERKQKQKDCKQILLLCLQVTSFLLTGSSPAAQGLAGLQQIRCHHSQVPVAISPPL